MGYGNYSSEAHEAMTQARSRLPTQQVFKQRECHPLMNPHGVRVRESRDSAEHPNSLGIAFALDVTGSMGAIPEQLARKELPKFMRLLGACGVQDPQVLFMAVGDATSDRAPLQVGQFETTAELMDQWLTWSFLEGGGGAGIKESYELALYFLAEHTDMDCWVKRKKRGYLFMTGDELPYPAVSRHQVDALLGEKLDEDVPVADAVAAVQETFEPFFLIPDLQRRQRCERAWRDLLGDRVVCMESPEDTCTVAAGLVAVNEGLVQDLDALARLLETGGVGRERLGATLRALTPFAASLGRDGAPLASGVGGWLRQLFK
jgi:hypothetical protein